MYTKYGYSKAPGRELFGVDPCVCAVRFCAGVDSIRAARVLKERIPVRIIGRGYTGVGVENACIAIPPRLCCNT